MNSKQRIKEILVSKKSSYWLCDQLKKLGERDPVDAYYDAKLLADIAKQQLDEVASDCGYPTSFNSK